MAINETLIERINQLARKAKETGLTDEEKVEQKKLRDEYIASFRGNLKSQLDTIAVVDQDGNKTRLKEKHEEKINRNKRFMS